MKKAKVIKNRRMSVQTASPKVQVKQLANLERKSETGMPKNIDAENQEGANSKSRSQLYSASANSEKSGSHDALPLYKELSIENGNLLRENQALKKNVSERFDELATLTLMLEATKAVEQETEQQLADLKAQLATYQEMQKLLDEAQEKCTVLTTTIEQLTESTASERVNLELELAKRDRNFQAAVAKLAEMSHNKISEKTSSKRLFGRVQGRTTPAQRQIANRANLLRSSGLFDSNWYLEQYPDVLAANMDPVEHYLRFGADEQRDPGPLFSTAAYALANPDVVQAKMNCLVHYLLHGRHEGRPIYAAR